MKPFQAVALASGAALTEREIALACASHNCEPEHIRSVEAWLERIRCSEHDLACGAHPPLHDPAARDLTRQGLPPRPVHNRNLLGNEKGRV